MRLHKSYRGIHGLKNLQDEIQSQTVCSSEMNSARCTTKYSLHSTAKTPTESMKNYKLQHV